jgi:REP element-mobilizing transposase RayT
MAYLSLNYHVVFCTRKREALIALPWRSRFHEYLGGTIRGLGGAPMGQGGIEDHVHLLFGLRGTHRLCDTVREIKKASTRWVHAEIGVRSFAWQESYAAFTVDWRGIPTVQRYIKNQEEHHRRRSYRDELVASLKEAEIPYDPQYVD